MRTSQHRSVRSRSGWCIRKSVCSSCRPRRRPVCCDSRGNTTRFSVASTRGRCCWRATIWSKTCFERYLSSSVSISGGENQNCPGELLVSYWLSLSPNINKQTSPLQSWLIYHQLLNDHMFIDRCLITMAVAW